MSVADIPADVDGTVTTSMAGTGRVVSPGVRWAFRFGKWLPTQEEWTLAAQCVQPEEKDRIGRFVFRKDSKSTMVGRLLLRKVVSVETRVAYRDVDLQRTERGKPYLANQLPAGRALFNFNVSHQGEFTVLAAEHCHLVGVDVIKVDYPRGSTLPQFFSRMNRQFTQQEWLFIRSTPPADEQIARFYRIWCLKEAYVKALGIGIGFELQRLDFLVNTPVLPPDVIVCDTVVLVDGQKDAAWTFEETKLDSEHYVAVALQDRGQPTPGGGTVPDTPVPFRTLTFPELIEGATAQSPPDEQYWLNFEAKLEKPG